MPDSYNKIEAPVASGGFFGTGVGTNEILQGARGPKGDTGDQGTQASDPFGSSVAGCGQE